MKIELRNVKYSKSLSEETNAFTAIVYIDGVKAGEVSNHGTGGCNDYHPHDLYNRLTEYAKTQPMVVCEEIKEPDGKPFTYVADADHFIDRAFARWMQEDDLKKALRKRVMFTKKGVAGLYSFGQRKGYPVLDDAQRISVDTVTMEKFSIDKILNLLPFDEAMSVYEAQAALESGAK